MKKKKDKIDSILAQYGQASAKRIAKRNAIQAREKAKEEARDRYEQQVKEKITDVFRPVMLHLQSRLNKKLFRCSSDKLGYTPEILEQYHIETIKEEDTDFWLALLLRHDEKKACFSYAYSTAGSKEHHFEEYIDLEDITEQFIAKKFALCLEKICL